MRCIDIVPNRGSGFAESPFVCIGSGFAESPFAGIGLGWSARFYRVYPGFGLAGSVGIEEDEQAGDGDAEEAV